MNLQYNDRNLWICSLRPEEIQIWANGSLNEKAILLGIKGWIVPLKINHNGDINESLWNHQNNNLLAAPWIDLKHPMSPAQEINLSSQLQKWWKGKTTLKIMDNKFLVLSGTHNLSHAKFSTKRFKVSFQDTLIIGIEEEWVGKQDGCIDYFIQANLKGSESHPANYLKNLKRAHHDMLTLKTLIPSVAGVTQKERSLWRNATESHYQQWLLQASAWSRIRYFEHAEAPIFINNWNSHKSCWKREFRSRIVQSKPGHLSKNHSRIYQWGTRKSENIAIMIHGFYLDKLKEILNYLEPVRNQSGIPKLDLYVSTPLNQINTIKELLKNQRWPRVYLCGAANQGRDIAPFLLNLLPAALRINHTAFIKLHTKQSPHLKNGQSWSDHLVSSLLDPTLLSTLKAEIQNNPKLGLIAPSGTLVPISVALSKNVDHLEVLLAKAGWKGNWTLNQSYIAGSMMAGRLSAIKPFEKLGLTIDHFEPEEGQTDGTLAHALERCISLQYLSQNLIIKILPGKSSFVPEFGYGWV